jgi:hypothetical protein
MRARSSKIGSEPNINLARRNMENLDDLMRKKFNTAEEAGRYEFQEQYWDQARALIEADERKRKRRRILLWWWFGGIFVLSMAGIYGIVTRQKAELAHTNNSKTEANAKHTDKHIGELDNGQNKTTTNTQTPDNKTDNKSNINSDTQTGYADDSSVSGSKGLDQKDRVNLQLSKAPNKPKFQANQADKAPQNALLTTLADVKTKNQTADIQSINSEKNNTTENSKNQTAPSLNTKTTTTEAGRDNTEASPKEDVDKSDLNKIEVSASALPSPAPPLGFWLLDIATPMPTTPQAPVPPIKIQKKRSHPLGVFVSVGQTLSSGSKQGAALGITYEGRLKHGLFYTGQLGWRYLPYTIGRDSLTPAASQQLRYSFGYQQNKSWFMAMNQHLLELPVGLGWRYKGLYVHGGLHSALRLATQATLLEESNATLSPNPEAKTSKIWLEKAPLPQFWVRPYAALGYGLGRFDVRVKAIWLPDFEARATDGQRNGTQWPVLDIGLGFRF